MIRRFSMTKVCSLVSFTAGWLLFAPAGAAADATKEKLAEMIKVIAIEFIKGVATAAGEYAVEEWTREKQTPAKNTWVRGEPHPVHPNVNQSDTPGKWSPAPGYSWVEEAGTNMAVRWTPGKAHDSIPNIYAGDKERHWYPKAGYRFIDLKAISKGVAWSPGSRHPMQSKAYALNTPDEWALEPGYVSPSGRPDDPKAKWVAYLKHPTRPNVVSSPSEGYWRPAAGFVYANTNAGSYSVVWTPGLKHPSLPNLVSADMAFHWTPAQGFSFVPGRPLNDLEVVATDLSGIGIMIVHDTQFQRPRIESITPGLPSEQARIRAGSLITKIFGEDTKGMTLAQCRAKLIGRQGSMVWLELLDPEDLSLRKVELKRALLISEPLRSPRKAL